MEVLSAFRILGDPFHLFSTPIGYSPRLESLQYSQEHFRTPSIRLQEKCPGSRLAAIILENGANTLEAK